MGAWKLILDNKECILVKELDWKEKVLKMVIRLEGNLQQNSPKSVKSLWDGPLCGVVSSVAGGLQQLQLPPHLLPHITKVPRKTDNWMKIRKWCWHSLWSLEVALLVYKLVS